MELTVHAPGCVGRKGWQAHWLLGPRLWDTGSLAATACARDASGKMVGKHKHEWGWGLWVMLHRIADVVVPLARAAVGKSEGTTGWGGSKGYRLVDATAHSRRVHAMPPGPGNDKALCGPIPRPDAPPASAALTDDSRACPAPLPAAWPTPMSATVPCGSRSIAGRMGRLSASDMASISTMCSPTPRPMRSTAGALPFHSESAPLVRTMSSAVVVTLRLHGPSSSGTSAGVTTGHHSVILSDVDSWAGATNRRPSLLPLSRFPTLHPTLPRPFPVCSLRGYHNYPLRLHRVLPPPRSRPSLLQSPLSPSPSGSATWRGGECCSLSDVDSWVETTNRRRYLRP